MTTEDFIIGLFCEVDDRMLEVPKHPQAKLWPSELVTVGILFAFKGGYFRAFYRWLKRDLASCLVNCRSERDCSVCWRPIWTIASASWPIRPSLPSSIPMVLS